MGGSGSGRPASGKKDNSRLTESEKIERNRVRARERWQRLRNEKEAGVDLSGYEKYKLGYKVRYHSDEERLGHLREAGKGFSTEEDPMEWMKAMREKNKKRLDDILNDEEAMERIFSDRNDISDLQRAAQRQKTYLSAKEIKEIEAKLNKEFNLVEDRKPNTYSTFKPINEEKND
jgi:hypothetical protein